MSPNLLELAQNYFIGSTVRQTSTAFGESESSIGTALRSVVPLVLSGLLGHAQQPGGAAELFGLAQQVHHNGLLGDLSGLLRGLSSPQPTEASLPSRGADMMRTLLGAGYAPAVEGVSQQAGVRSATVSNLLSVATAVLLGLLGRQAAQNDLDAAGLATYLASQRDNLSGVAGSLPSNLSRLVAELASSPAAEARPIAAATSRLAVDSNLAPGVNHAAAITPPSPTAPVGDASRSSVRRAVRPAAPVPAATPRRWPWLLVLVVGLAALGYFLVRGGSEQPLATKAATAAAATDTARTAPAPSETVPAGRYEAASGNYRYATGPSTTVPLPGGPTLDVGHNSTEARLFRELTGAAQAASPAQAQTGIVLDRIFFATGNATLTPESQAQLTNLAALLRAFPQATLKLGGFTDNQGPAEANLLLSADRANAVRSALVKAGISPTRVAAQGYGQEHPLAENDTPEGRAQNRRVALLVTKK